jgi:hypothetical protein
VSDWIEWKGEEWYNHAPGDLCPCPADMEVDVFYRVGSSPRNRFFTSWGERVFGHAGGIDWSCVVRWRPDPDEYECRFERNKLVAYRRKEKTT